MELISVQNLRVRTAEREILHGVDMAVRMGETVVILGANGAGKSTLLSAIMGMGAVDGEITGEVKFLGEEISGMGMDARARKGIFMSWQAPVEVNGVTMMELLRTAVEEQAGRGVPRMEIERKVAEGVKRLQMEAFAAGREVNVGASGGERKKNEILQMLVLEPKLVMLDEIDSGLDVDAAKLISEVVGDYQRQTGAGLVVVTHNMRILENLRVDRAYIMKQGRMEKQGGEELISEVMKKGFGPSKMEEKR